MPSLGTRIEHALESVLFASRWLLAPFYLGMVLALAIVLFVFGHECLNELIHIRELDAEGAILFSLSLIDLSLTGNLLVIVMFSGYESAGCSRSI
jgi:uncharacterized protein (TIGR00645 family)